LMPEQLLGLGEIFLAGHKQPFCSSAYYRKARGARGVRFFYFIADRIYKKRHKKILSREKDTKNYKVFGHEKGRIKALRALRAAFARWFAGRSR
jgi:hypothetical protein